MRRVHGAFGAVFVPWLAVIVSIAFYMVPVSGWAQSSDVYILNTPTREPFSTGDGKGFLDLLVADVFQRIGLKGRVAEYTASKRALINANADVDQGVAMRVKGLEAEYPNLVRVPEPIFKIDFVSFSLDPGIDANSWKALRPISVAYILGWVVYEKNLLPGTDAITVKRPEQLFTLLRKRRVDAILYELWMGLHIAKERGLRVVVGAPPLARVNMYMYLNKKHIKLVGKLAQALRDMKADGTYQAIYDKTLTQAMGGDVYAAPGSR